MRAYVLVNPNNNRLVNNQIPTYPSILPPYDVVFGPTVNTIGDVPDWYIRIDGWFEEHRKRDYCAYKGHMDSIAAHYDSYPDESLLVLEDDVEFEPDFNTYYQNFMKMVPDDWDAIYFGGWYHETVPKEVVPNVLSPSGPGFLYGAECILLSPELVKSIVSYHRSEPTTSRIQFDATLAAWIKIDKIKVYTPIVMFAHQKASYSAMREKVWDEEHDISNIKYYRSLGGALLPRSKADLSRYSDR